MRRISTLSLLTLLCLNLLAQRIIDRPRFSATTANYVNITRIELQDTVTIVDFRVEFFPKWWIEVSSYETYLQNSDGGEKLYVTRAKGIKINEKHWTPESGINEYTLYFPPIDKNVEKIDYLEGRWKIFDIDLKGGEAISIIPKELQGNWLRADGSNQWEYGIYNDIVIYDNTVWDNVSVKKKRKTYRLTLKNETSQKDIEIRLKKQNLLVGNSRKNRHLLSKTNTYNPTYVIENDEEYQLPILNMDTAIYKGFIRGYHPKMGKTGIVYVNDIITNEQNSHLIHINSNGSFSSKIPMIYPQEVYVRIFDEINETVLLEPGRTVFHYMDLSEFTKSFKSFNDRNKRERMSLFMGEVARVNTDLLAIDTIDYFDHNQIQNSILYMSGNDFKDHCLYIINKEQSTLSEFTKNYPLSKKALQIKNLEIPYRTHQIILSYNRMKSDAYRQKYNIPRDQHEVPLEPETFKPDYYDFLNPDQLNNPISVVSGGAYYTLINYLKFSESIRPKPNYVYVALKDSIVSKKIPMSLEEVRLLGNLMNSKSDKRIEKVIASDVLTWEILKERHSDIIASIKMDGYKQVQFANMKTYYGLDKGFARDIMYAQSKCGKMTSMQKPFDEADKKDIRQSIANQFIVDYILQYNDIEERKINSILEANKSKTGYTINTTPDTVADKLFDTIISKCKGKVVVVDFWATWCEPCRRGIEQIRPLKEEIKNTAIAFVYITNPSSPTETWNMLIPAIKGEHFRVTQDEWNHFKAKFNISSIPHYVLIDKNGQVVNDKFNFTSNEELKRLLDTYLRQ